MSGAYNFAVKMSQNWTETGNSLLTQLWMPGAGDRCAMILTLYTPKLGQQGKYSWNEWTWFGMVLGP